jgi:hypothetical protein
MNRRVFEASVTDLSTHIKQAVAGFFEERGLAFDLELLTEQASTDISYMAREAHFFGADLYPEDTTAAA